MSNINDSITLNNLIKKHKINLIIHAAAYKHVNILEDNILSAVNNNIFGTKNLCEISRKNNIDLILISTDKAVRPTNVMGASKRIAELVLQALDRGHHDTCFTMVRFGNVLDSSGSVIPLFRKQIKEGGPLTVTHKDITRYFMTIPEACQLVLQAGALGNGGEIFVFDM